VHVQVLFKVLFMLVLQVGIRLNPRHFSRVLRDQGQGLSRQYRTMYLRENILKII